LAVYFEAPACSDCEVMHKRVLSDPPTRALAKKMNNVQLDVYDETPLVTVDGRRISARDYARELGIAYTPSVVFCYDTDIWGYDSAFPAEAQGKVID